MQRSRGDAFSGLIFDRMVDIEERSANEANGPLEKITSASLPATPPRGLSLVVRRTNQEREVT
jgi:hypothetical protein